MIIEEQLPTPKGYVSARVVTFRGDAAEEADYPEDRYSQPKPQPAWTRFVDHLKNITGVFTSDDVPGFSVKQSSRYLTRATQRGLIRKVPQKIQIGTGRPKNVYEVRK